MKATSDRDSIAALDALLRIRKSGEGVDSSVPRTGPNQSGPLTSPQELAAIVAPQAPLSSLSQLTALNTLLPFTASTMTLPRQTTVPSTTVQAHYQLVAAQAAANWNGSRLLGASKPPLSLLSHTNVSSPSTAASTANTKTMSPSLAPITPEEVTVSKSMLLKDTARRSSIPKQPSSQNAENQRPIRQQKVEEALRSKPQRGRKRDDLNEDERLELTRTRNREHAKTTRIRKKARYQELLDREGQYLELRKELDLQSERQQVLQCFITLRQDMLVEAVENQVRSQAEKIDSTNDQQQSRESSSVAASSNDPTSSTSKTLKDLQSQLTDLVEATPAFKFQWSPPGGHVSGSEQALVRMQNWDQAVARDISTFLASEERQAIVYDVEGGQNGVALSKDGHAFCRMNVQVPASSTHSGQSRVLLTGIFSASFAPESSRLALVEWTTLTNHSQVPVSQQSKIRAVTPTGRLS